MECEATGLVLPIVIVGGFYLYVAAAITRAAVRGGSTLGNAVVKGLAWPATVWQSMNKRWDL